MEAGNRNWPASEIVRQIEITRQQSGATGHIHWNMSALMRDKGGVNEALLRNEYNQPALPPALNGGSARLDAPKLTARTTSKGVEFRCEMEGDAHVRFFIVQERHNNGTWHTRIAPGKPFTQEQSPPPAIIAVRALDRFGNVGEANVLERSEAAAR
jgi:hypothetical protein